MCYYFDGIMNGTKFNFSNILLNKKSYENISVYNILYKTLTVPKPLCVKFDKTDGFIVSLLIVKINIEYFLIMGCLIKFVIRFNIL